MVEDIRNCEGNNPPVFTAEEGVYLRHRITCVPKGDKVAKLFPFAPHGGLEEVYVWSSSAILLLDLNRVPVVNKVKQSPCLLPTFRQG